MKKAENKLNSRYEYEQCGGKMLKMTLLSHKMQRSVASDEYISQNQYLNNSKISTKQKLPQ